MNSVPLSYVAREQEEVDRNGTFKNLNERTIAYSSLNGPIFQADARKVRQLLKSFLQTETAEQWIKPLTRKQSGRTVAKEIQACVSRMPKRSATI